MVQTLTMPTASSGTSTSTTVVLPELMDIYNQTLQLNQQNYQRILQAYGQGQQRLQATLPTIYQGYNQLSADVGNILGFGGRPWGVAEPAAQAIKQQFDRSFTANQGSIQQQAINAGLGNTTVLGNYRAQNAQMEAQSAGIAYGNLGAQLAKMYADSATGIGLGALSAQMQGLGMQTGLTQAYGNTLGGYRFGNTVGNLTGTVSESTQGGGTGGFGSGGGGSSGGGKGYGQTPQPSYAGIPDFGASAGRAYTGLTQGITNYAPLGDWGQSYQPGPTAINQTWAPSGAGDFREPYSESGGGSFDSTSYGGYYGDALAGDFGGDWGGGGDFVY